MNQQRRPRLWVIDPSMNNPEDEGIATIVDDWPGESRIFRPVLSPGDGPDPQSGYDTDGIVLMGCQKGDNYQCHFVKGSEIAHVRMSKIDDTLQSLSLEEERVATYEVAITDIERAPQLINDMAATVEKVGMSPFKF